MKQSKGKPLVTPSSATTIHPTAIVDSQAQLGSGVEIGPFCLVGPHVQLGDGVRLLSHVVVTGYTTLQAGVTVYPFASLGHAPQDLKYAGEPSTVVIGEGTILREYVTVQPGTQADRMTTTIGDHCLLMASAHVAHDCVVGHHVIMANNATLGGHVHVGDYTVIGGLSAIHQFVRVGAHAMIGGTAGVTDNVIPFGVVTPGRYAQLDGLNLVGLKRRGLPSEHIVALRDAYQALFLKTDASLAERIKTLPPALQQSPLVAEVLLFIETQKTRPLCMPPRASA